jgi:ABC-type transport system involved in multi-copper enzyme maturation permease subunit
MKLEAKKFKMYGNIKGVLITTLVITALTIMIGYAAKYDNTGKAFDYTMAVSIIDSMVRNTFIIFAAVVLGEFVIGEYKNKTITVLFLYPISRKKLIVSKLIIIGIFIFISIIFTSIITNFSFYLFNKYANFTGSNLSMDFIMEQSIMIAVKAAATAVISLIPLYFGMRKKSVPATIVSAIIMVCIIGSNNGETSLDSILPLQIALALIGILAVYLSIRNIEKVDI